MLIGKKKLMVIGVLDSVLGTGSSLKDNEQTHHCPFCHHPKKKLQVNLDTQKWHCWVCNAGGRTINTLLRKLYVPLHAINTIRDIYGDDESNPDIQEPKIILQLPPEFRQLYNKPKSINPHYNNAISYLKRRGIRTADIVKYNIGYCETGLYAGRIIIPSYDENGELNYFIARSYYENEKYKYKNPPVNRDVIVFEDMVNWNEPITLVEGGFDAFSVRRNVIPLLGKFLLPKLKDKIRETGVKNINILLDPDAITESVKLSEYFISNGIHVKNIIPHDVDAGELGFEKVNELISTSPETLWDDMVLTKIKSI